MVKAILLSHDLTDHYQNEEKVREKITVRAHDGDRFFAFRKVML